MSASSPGLGPTDELNLRVSVATLSRVLFPHPADNASMLALEHKTHVQTNGESSEIFLQAQPFGGGARLLNKAVWQELLEDFHFDSTRSQTEGDFRIFIHPSRWPQLKQTTIEELERGASALIDSDPARELEEEFQETMNIQLKPDQYTTRRVAIAVEEKPRPTHSWRAPGQPTARIYAIDEVKLVDPGLCRSVIAASQRQTPERLLEIARRRASVASPGRANGVLVAPLAEVEAAFLNNWAVNRAEPLSFAGSKLSGNVIALLEGINSPQYEMIQL